MNILRPVLIACAFSAMPAAAADADRPCAAEAAAPGLEARVDAMRGQLERLPAVDDRGEKLRIMRLHAKHMDEGLRELRRRRDRLELPCRLHLTQALLEQAIGHQLAARDLDER